ncbi:MAG: hypothetical protein J1E65_08570 [Lachnospiraceae bacterium]|nr:hypothetical protein [Lachnospiraceae bacterium]
MSNFMWKNKNDTNNDTKKSLNQKAIRPSGREIVLSNLPAYLMEPNPRQPRYYMDHAADAVLKRKVTVADRLRPVIQLYPDPNIIDQNSNPIPAFPQNNLIAPTMYFESMGRTMRECESIYSETTKYNGNTVCVFGLNTSVKDFKDKDNIQTEFVNLNKEMKKSSIFKNNTSSSSASPVHYVSVFPFVWRKPAEVEESEYYKMPFIEARLAIMRHAQAIADAHASECNVPPLFRWIDGDATNDTSNSISDTEWRQWAEDQNKKVITGGYDWRHESVGTATNKPTYHKFVNMLNQVETILRSLFHKKVKNEWSYPHLSQNDYLPGFYLPETALVMNQQAHQAILYRLNGYASVDSQQKESMHIVDTITKQDDYETPYNTIIYSSQLKAEKPLKFEFDEDNSYLGGDMLKFLKKNNKPLMDQAEVPAGLIDGLKDLRQSIFEDHWFFKDGMIEQKWENPPSQSADSPVEILQNWFNQKRLEYAQKIWDVLKANDRLKKIYMELTGSDDGWK